MDNLERNWQHWAIKNGQSREKLATLDTQDKVRKQTKQKTQHRKLKRRATAKLDITNDNQT